MPSIHLIGALLFGMRIPLDNPRHVVTRWNMRTILGFVILALGFAIETRADSKWEKDIAAFEAADKTNPPPQDAVLFVGSSSIRRWTNLAQAFPEHRVINRGFGGSHLADSVAFADRIVTPYRPKLVLLYAGDNDIAAGKSPEEVFADFKEFVKKVRSALPETRIAYISIKPSTARERYLPLIKQANRLIKEHAEANKKLLFIDVFTPMLDAEGKPRAELLMNDGLHPNAAGYKLWASIVKPVLDKVDPPQPATK